jgi:hypothetical protein
MEAIIEVLLKDRRAADPMAIRHVVKQQLAGTPSLTGRRALLLASSMASTYMRRFAPSDEWRLVGRNLAVGRGRADLLFSNGREWFVDELKAARIRPDDAALHAQVAAYQEGRRIYGNAFLGVRVALLRAPAQLLFFPASQAREPLPAARAR